MSEVEQITTELARLWLNDMGAAFYTCDHCAGLHITRLGGDSDMEECRLFVEEWGLLFSTEFQIRPSMLLPLMANLGQLNGNYPTLKLFMDIPDEAVPQMVAGATLLTGAGISHAQFSLFVSTSVEMTLGVQEDLNEMGCLIEDVATEPGEGHRLH